MGTGRRLLLFAVICVGASLLFVSCGGGDGGCGCDVPRRTQEWLVEIDYTGIPAEVVEYPFFVEATVHVSNIENGTPAADGTVVTLSISPGSFEDGATETNLPTAIGRVVVRIQVDAAGRYTLTVSLPGESSSVSSVFNIGV